MEIWKKKIPANKTKSKKKENSESYVADFFLTYVYQF